VYRFVVSLPIALGGLADVDSMMEGVDVEALSSCLVLPKPRKPRFLGLDSTFPVSCSGCLPIEFVWVGVEDPVEEECVSWRLLMAGACASLMVADLGGRASSVWFRNNYVQWTAMPGESANGTNFKIDPKPDKARITRNQPVGCCQSRQAEDCVGGGSSDEGHVKESQ
jgi:hypothetical protein